MTEDDVARGEKGDSKAENPYASPLASDTPATARSGAGAAWGLLIGAVQGSRYGMLAGVTLAAVATAFYAVTRSPGWFGPSEGMALRLGLYFLLSAMVGGVAGMVVGAGCGVLVGATARLHQGKSFDQVGAALFAIGGGLLTVVSWGQEMLLSDSPLRLLAYGFAIAVAAAYAAAAGRQTGISITRVLEKIEQKERLERLSETDRN